MLIQILAMRMLCQSAMLVCFLPHSQLTLQDSETLFTDVGNQQTIFSGKRKGQAVMALLAAHALNNYPVLLDLTDGVVHHLLQLMGTSLIAWEDLTP